MKSLVRWLGAGVLVALAGACQKSMHIGPDPSGTSAANGAGGASSSANATSGTTASTGSGPTGQAGYVSGSRLRARYLAGDDGSKEFIGWFDGKRMQPCAFKATKSGGLRCLPLLFATPVPNLYSDAACTIPAVTFANGGCPTTETAVTVPAGGLDCATGGPNYDVYLAQGGGQNYTKNGNGCFPTSSSAATVGAAVPLTDFASAKEMTE